MCHYTSDRRIPKYPMKNKIYLILTCFTTVLLFGVTACSSAGGTAKHDPPKHDPPGDYVQIQPRAYNSESRSFDRPWPFGPESSVQ